MIQALQGLTFIEKAIEDTKTVQIMNDSAVVGSYDDVEFHLPPEPDFELETYYTDDGVIYAVILDRDTAEYATFNNGDKINFLPF